MEQDKIIKGYDPVIMRRLLGFIKPYRFSASVAVLALLIAIVAELATPIIMQRAIDDTILARYYRLEKQTETTEILREQNLLDGAVELDSFYYLLESQIEKIPGEVKQELEKKGLYQRESWYISEAQDDPKRNELFRRYPGSFQLVENYAIIQHSEIDKLTGEEKIILRSRNINQLAEQTLLYFGLLTASLIFMFVQVYLMAHTGQEVMRDIRGKLYGHTIRQSLSYLGRTPVGTLVTRITNDVETINEFFTSVATSILRDFSLMIGVIITMIILDVKLALITIITLPPVFILTLLFRTRARDAYRRVRMWVSRVNAFLSEHISGMEVVQIFGRESRSQRDFSERNHELLKSNLSEMMVFATFRPLINLLTSISIGTILYFGGRMVLETTVSLGIMIAFVNLIGKFYQPVMDFAEKFTIMQSAMAGGERIFNLLDTENRIPDEGEKSLPSPVSGRIDFEQVHFRYNQDEPVIQDLSFTIQPGETVAIVGYTGAGKTTIANLLARMWDLDGGVIKIDGVDIKDIPLRKLRETVQPVQQDVFLFAETITENIRLGADISDARIREAAEIVQASRFIEKLPREYETYLSERGANLSTGQRQLLSFTRVIAHDPRILILDEATGSIDTETERLIQSAIERLMEGRTAIVIAHRLSTIKNADRILVLNEGRLAEQGTHEQLIAEDGLYATLYRLQYQAQTA